MMNVPQHVPIDAELLSKWIQKNNDSLQNLCAYPQNKPLHAPWVGGYTSDPFLIWIERGTINIPTHFTDQKFQSTPRGRGCGVLFAGNLGLSGSGSGLQVLPFHV